MQSVSSLIRNRITYDLLKTLCVVLHWLTTDFKIYLLHDNKRELIGYTSENNLSSRNNCNTYTPLLKGRKIF